MGLIVYQATLPCLVPVSHADAKEGQGSAHMRCRLVDC